MSLDLQNPVWEGDNLNYMQETVAFIMYRSELQVWSKMWVLSGEVFSGPSSAHNASMVSLESQSSVKTI